MLDYKKDDTFLSRWINDELSEEELQAFQKHPDYEHYMNIKHGMATLEVVPYDVEEQLRMLKGKRSQRKATPVKKLWPYLAIAASILVIIGFFLFQTDDTFTTTYGEQVSVILPDGSEMILNAKSTARFNTKQWNNDRTVSLNGEAFFKVKKGSTFTVVTKNGNVSVLGTQFTVQSDVSFFEVRCYEGKVNVTHQKKQLILTPGKGYRKMAPIDPEDLIVQAKSPSWLQQTSTFKSIPVLFVFKELEDQYGITINSGSLDTSILYTGSFPNNNIKVALQTVFSTLGISYTLSKDKKTVVLEK